MIESERRGVSRRKDYSQHAIESSSSQDFELELSRCFHPRGSDYGSKPMNELPKDTEHMRYAEQSKTSIPKAETPAIFQKRHGDHELQTNSAALQAVEFKTSHKTEWMRMCKQKTDAAHNLNSCTRVVEDHSSNQKSNINGSPFTTETEKQQVKADVKVIFRAELNRNSRPYERNRGELHLNKSMRSQEDVSTCSGGNAEKRCTDHQRSGRRIYGGRLEIHDNTRNGGRSRGIEDKRDDQSSHNVDVGRCKVNAGIRIKSRICSEEYIFRDQCCTGRATQTISHNVETELDERTLEQIDDPSHFAIENLLNKEGDYELLSLLLQPANESPESGEIIEDNSPGKKAVNSNLDGRMRTEDRRLKDKIRPSEAKVRGRGYRDLKTAIDLGSNHQKLKEDREKAIEEDPHRLSQRQKQINYGKNTPGYQHYLQCVPRHKRRLHDPATPDKHQSCSKRSWDGQIRKWRRVLHAFDPPQERTGNNEDNDRTIQ